MLPFRALVSTIVPYLEIRIAYTSVWFWSRELPCFQDSEASVAFNQSTLRRLRRGLAGQDALGILV